MDKTNHHNSEQSGDAINRAEEGSVCRAERSGADRASGVGALPGADEAPTLPSFTIGILAYLASVGTGRMERQLVP